MERIVDRGIVVVTPPDASKRRGARPGWDGGLYAFMRRVLATEQGGDLSRQRQPMIEPATDSSRAVRRYAHALDAPRSGRAALLLLARSERLVAPRRTPRIRLTSTESGGVSPEDRWLSRAGGSAGGVTAQGPVERYGRPVSSMKIYVTCLSRRWQARTAGVRRAGRPGSSRPSSRLATRPAQVQCPGRRRGTAARPGRRPRGR